jgi:nucleoside-diphosphate-sugar epimerase
MHGAVDGIARILESALNEPGIKSFVFMSSVTAIISSRDNYTFTENDWNTEAEAVVAAEGKAAPGRFIYAASKTAAERALWKFQDENKPHFTITAINPW